MFKIFNLTLIVVYISCGCSQFAAYPFLNSAKDTVFTTSENNYPFKTHYLSVSLSKHFHSVKHSETQDHLKTAPEEINVFRFSAVDIPIPLQFKAFQAYQTSPLNKAPPLV